MKWLLIIFLFVIPYTTDKLYEKKVQIRCTHYMDSDGIERVMFENYTDSLSNNQAIELLIKELKGFSTQSKTKKRL